MLDNSLDHLNNENKLLLRQIQQFHPRFREIVNQINGINEFISISDLLKSINDDLNIIVSIVEEHNRLSDNFLCSAYSLKLEMIKAKNKKQKSTPKSVVIK